MDLKGMVDKAKNALKSNPDLIEKGGDLVDKATGNKYASQVDKAQDAARKAVGAQDRGEQTKSEQTKGEQNRDAGDK
ncbi:antitoxin [Gordonia shandongensis]|uniref:antitoxin n=1 Tax=Gordonia shandongensis TaxID=376351 RepID=UPI000407588C|nr:antitoxin [Gordonia shandongensis]